MQYERPAQYDMREFFRPVAPLEIQHRLEEPDLLLSAFASRQNFAMQPVRVMAFFKKVDNKLLLDWDVFTQTKYRTLRHFVTHPSPNGAKEFRVMAREVLPAGESAGSEQERVFRLSDPAHANDYVDVPVAMDSPEGRILSELAWINLPGREAQHRYATVELSWVQEGERNLVNLDRILCWEFLGLGGEEGNADPIGDSIPADVPVDLDELEPDPLAPAPPAINDGEATAPAAISDEEGPGEGELPEEGEIAEPGAPETP